MKKISFVVIIVSICIISFLICMSTSSWGEIYVPIDKETGNPNGMVDINPDSVGEWAKKYNMKKADESYRGKQAYEIKFENSKLRHATKEEIDAYKLEEENKIKALRKQSLLDELGITKQQLDKLKAL